MVRDCWAIYKPRYHRGMADTTWLGPPQRGTAQRVVSLVPSLTEAVFQLGAGAALVARTKFCIRPSGAVDAVPTVRGTKNPDVAAIRALQPDLVLANKEENQRAHIEDLARSFPVCLTNPESPHEVPALWRDLGTALGAATEAARLAGELGEQLARAPARQPNAPRFLYLIWRDPWMAAAHDTYISQLLTCAGMQNALAPEQRRYPTLTPKQVADTNADLVLFSSEPFAFRFPRDLDLFPEAAALAPDAYALREGRRALLVDGERLSWYPSQTSAGLRYARTLADNRAY